MAAPKFFKVILDPKSDSLRIPPEFTKRMGHNLPGRVFLKVPTGPMAMEVELVWYDGKTLMLQKGWKEFSEHHSIGFGHFLVFEYNGKSEFNVVIFDKSAVEINYPFVNAENQENTTQPLQQERGSKSKFAIPNYHSERKPDYCRVKLDHESTYEECSDIGGGRQFSKRVEMQREVVKKETSIAYEKAVAFASARIKSPLIRLMQHSYVSYGFSLNVPLWFVRQNLPCKGAYSISMVTGGKRWSVRCIVNRRATVTGGWKGFVQDNGLKVGDVCIFQVVNNSKRHVWNVVIFRAE